MPGTDVVADPPVVRAVDGPEAGLEGSQGDGGRNGIAHRVKSSDASGLLLRIVLCLVMLGLAPAAERVPRVGIIGDSLSMPRAPAALVPSWPELLMAHGRIQCGPTGSVAEETPDARVRWNRARNGMTSGEALDADLPAELLAIHESYALDAVLVVIGSDDLSVFEPLLRSEAWDRAAVAAASDALVTNLLQLVQRLRDDDQPPTLIVATVPDWSHTPFVRRLGLGATRLHAIREVTARINRRIRLMAAEEGVILADLAAHFDHVMRLPEYTVGSTVIDRQRAATVGDCFFQADGVHPGAVATAAMANVMIRALAETGLAIQALDERTIAESAGLPLPPDLSHHAGAAL